LPTTAHASREDLRELSDKQSTLERCAIRLDAIVEYHEKGIRNLDDRTDKMETLIVNLNAIVEQHEKERTAIKPAFPWGAVATLTLGFLGMMGLIIRLAFIVPLHTRIDVLEAQIMSVKTANQVEQSKGVGRQ